MRTRRAPPAGSFKPYRHLATAIIAFSSVISLHFHFFCVYSLRSFCFTGTILLSIFIIIIIIFLLSLLLSCSPFLQRSVCPLQMLDFSFMYGCPSKQLPLPMIQCTLFVLKEQSCKNKSLKFDGKLRTNEVQS